jgi:hypothetical protein
LNKRFSAVNIALCLFLEHFLAVVGSMLEPPSYFLTERWRVFFSKFFSFFLTVFVSFFKVFAILVDLREKKSKKTLNFD